MRAVGRQWGQQEEMLANLVELLDVLVRVTVKAHSNPKRPPKFGKPLHWPRPWDKDRKRQPFAGMPMPGRR